MVTCEKPAEVELRVRSPGVDDVTCVALRVRVRVDQVTNRVRVPVKRIWSPNRR